MKAKITLLLAGAAMALSFLTGCESSDSGGGGKSHPSRCEVTFKNYDASVLYFNTVEYGGTAVYQGETPTRPGNGQERYYFSGWDRSLENIKSDTTFIAQYSTKPTSFKITWNDYDGTFLNETSVEYGQIPTYPGESPTRPDSGDYYYEFSGWDPKPVAAVEDATYTATYEEYHREDNTKSLLKIHYSVYNPKTGALAVDYAQAPSGLGNVSETGEYNKGSNIDLYAHPFTGYEFVGWYYEGTCLSNEEDYNFRVWSHDIELEARFKYSFFYLDLSSYNTDYGTVSAYSENGLYYDYQENGYKVFFTEEVTLTAYTITDVYRFIGWYKYQNELVSNNAVYKYSMPNSNMKIEAKWNRFSISYFLDGGFWNWGTDYKTSYSYEPGDSSTYTLPTPYKTGYNFVGWKVNDGLSYSETIDLSKLIDYTVTAYWTPITYKIVYHANGGTGEMEDQTCTYDEYSYVQECVYTKTGYSFKYWTRYEDGSGSRYYAGNGIYNLTTTDGGVITLYAYWEVGKSTVATYYVDPKVGNSVTVSFVTNGANEEVEQQVIPNGKTIQNPGILTKEGYVFTGWYSDKGCQNLYDFSSSLTGDFTLYAGWGTADDVAYERHAEYKFDPLLYGDSETLFKTDDSGTTYSACNYYYFTVSNTTTNARIFWRSTYYGLVGALIDLTTNTKLLGDITFTDSYLDGYYFSAVKGHIYALKLWYNYSYYSGGAEFYFTGLEASTNGKVAATEIGFSKIISYDSEYSYTGLVESYSDLLTRTSCEFDGFFDKNNLRYTDKTGAAAGTWFAVDDVDLYTRWTYTEFNITYVLDEGTNSPNNPTKFTISSKNELEGATKVGYDFKGWYLEDTFENKFTAFDGSIEQDLTLYAKFELAQYQITVVIGDIMEMGYTFTVHFETNGANESVDDQVLGEYGSLTYPGALTKAGYTFTGWYKDQECTELYDFTEDVGEDTTVYAGWRETPVPEYYNAYMAINPYTYTSSNPMTVGQGNTYSSAQNYYYFTALKTGSCSLYYKTSSNLSSARIYLTVYDVTASTTVVSQFYMSNYSSYNYKTLSLIQGHTYYVSTYRYNTGSSPTLYMYFSGYPTPEAGGKACDSFVATVTYSLNYSIKVPSIQGYTFLGYFDSENNQYTDENGNSLAPWTLTYGGVILYGKWTQN